MSNENLESKRWGIAMAAVVMQLCLGTVYAWSVFKKPLINAHGWGETQTQLTFMIFMFTIGCAAAFGGTLVDKKGPKFVATIGGVLFGISTLLAGYADQIGGLTLLYISIAFTPLYYFLVEKVIGAPQEIVEPARLAMFFGFPWTFAVAYRRFHQGLMIRFGHSREITTGTPVSTSEARAIARATAAILGACGRK